MEDQKRLPKREVAYLVLLYTIMHGGIFLAPNAVFWDDWLIYRNSSSAIFQTFSEAGAILNWGSYLHIFMMGTGVWIYKLFTFFLMLGAGLLFAFILKRNSLIPKSLQFIIVLFFLILPFNFARIAAIDFPYALSYFLFFLAWSLIDRHRITAAGLFLFSFNTNSLLVFYFLPILDLLYRTCRPLTVKEAMKFPLSRPELMILPFAFFYVKVKYFKPFGDYEGYNQNFKLKNIPNAAKEQLLDLSKIELNWNWPLFSAFLVVAIYLTRNNIQHNLQKIDWKTSIAIFFTGIFLFILGAIPYWTLDLVPTFYEWASRHQLLLPMGTSLVLAGFIWIFPRPIRILGTSLVIATSLSLGIVTYYEFAVDWSKQKLLITLFATNNDVRGAEVVLIDDQTTSLNAIKREFRFYEWNGLLEEAFGDQTRFAISKERSKWYFDKEANQFFSERYKAAMHNPGKVPKTVTVKITQLPSVCQGACLLPNYPPKLVLTSTVFGDK